MLNGEKRVKRGQEVDLHELAIEYCDLLGYEDDEDYEMEPEEVERLALLKELDEALGGNVLYYPNDASSLEVVEEGEEADFAMQWADALGLIDNQSPLYSHIDWEAYGNDLLSDFTAIEWNGETFQVRMGY